MQCVKKMNAPPTDVMDAGEALLLRVMCPLKKIGYVLGNIFFLKGEEREGSVGSMEGMCRVQKEDDA